MTTYLQQLARRVLQAQPEGLSKVRFAKTLYFVHKALIAKGLSQSTDIKYIRMPLGPVPVGFDTLSSLEGLRVVARPTGLSYDQQLYQALSTTKVTRIDQDNRSLAVVRVAVQRLVKLPTSNLVGYSHDEPTWLEHHNGEQYFIAPKDLQRGLPPVKGQSVIDDALDNQHLQARLIKGMLDEIVDESTALEYPNERRTGDRE